MHLKWKKNIQSLCVQCVLISALCVARIDNHENSKRQDMVSMGLYARYLCVRTLAILRLISSFVQIVCSGKFMYRFRFFSCWKTITIRIPFVKGKNRNVIGDEERKNNNNIQHRWRSNFRSVYMLSLLYRRVCCCCCFFFFNCSILLRSGCIPKLRSLSIF